MAGEELDVYRQTPVRYLGYANEIGEAFRSIIGSRWVLFSYKIATGYVLADTIDKSNRTYRKNCHDPWKKTLYTATDTLVWQMLASVIIPGFTINRVCYITNYLLRKGRMPCTARRWIVSGVGLATIPLIIKPIDDLVDVVLDETIRKFEPE